MSPFGLMELYENEKEPRLTLPFTIGSISNKKKEYYLLYETSAYDDEPSQFTSDTGLQTFTGDVLDTGFRENKEPKLTIIYVIRAPVSSFLRSNTFTSLDTSLVEQSTPIRTRKTELKNIILYNDRNYENVYNTYSIENLKKGQTKGIFLYSITILSIEINIPDYFYVTLTNGTLEAPYGGTFINLLFNVSDMNNYTDNTTFNGMIIKPLTDMNIIFNKMMKTDTSGKQIIVVEDDKEIQKTKEEIAKNQMNIDSYLDIPYGDPFRLTPLFFDQINVYDTKYGG